KYVKTLSFPGILRPECADTCTNKSGEECSAEAFLRRYYDTHGRYTGSRFESFGHPWDAMETANVITASDLLAVQCLSVDMPAKAAISILETDAEQISGLLAQIPIDCNLWDAEDDVIGENSPADQLWWVLRGYHGIGPVKASKIMARKRARLIPIFDQIVGRQLGMVNKRDQVVSGGHWMGMRALLNQPVPGADVPLHKYLQDLHAEAELSELVTPLRIFDVAVWMDGKAKQK
ncbi:MAG: DUF6308 family protein, partial [Cellulomonadaceae bacterium]|nr:DUF6308 family protein [Cellulomonadaceae bacterium]